MSTPTMWNSFETAETPSGAPEPALEQVMYGHEPEPEAEPEVPRASFNFGTNTPASQAVSQAVSQGNGAYVTGDEFQALEQKVLRAVEIVRREREARAAAEAEVTRLQAELAALASASTEVQTQLTALHQERDSVRVRVERLLRQMDELL